MKKIAFILAVLLFAAPALAQTTVTISAVQVPGTNQVEISYVSDGNLPRAFGLDITVTATAIITECTPAMVGECNDLVRGFGIFPGTIQIDGDGNVTDDGTPVSPDTYNDTLGGLGTNGITVEMGSLYVDGNEPPLEGVLCTITVTENCTVNIAGNAARCGTGSPALGVVMVDWTEVPTVLYEPGDVTLELVCDCLGEVTGDNKVNVDDVIAIVGDIGAYGSGKPISIPSTDTANYDLCADATCDGKVNIDDVIKIVGWIGAYGSGKPLSITCPHSYE